MIPNILVLVASAFIPFIVAFIWFHKNLFGGENWAKIAGLTLEQNNTPVKPLKLALSILLNFFIAFELYNLVVHGSGVFGMVSANVEALKTGSAAAFLNEYGQNHLTFGHGLVHGIFATVGFAVPFIGYATIFERKSAKYFWVNVGFWLVSLTLMGGAICQWGAVKVY